MSIEFERDGKRWVLTAEHVKDNADNRDADAHDLALAGAEAMKRYALLEEALCWLPPGTVVEYHGDLDGFLEEVQALGWEPGGGSHAP